MINNPFNSTSNLQFQEQERRVFNQFIQNAGSKTALQPKGKLVHENPIQGAVSGVKDFGMDVVNLGKAIKDGDSCDHYLGRLNDLGMKLGGLGIASYLCTRKLAPKAKAMEFIGAGTFFAMMSLWPKIFIAAPLKARFGFDVNQKYIDSQGRKKDLYLDNGYIPKLESKEELQKAADRLNIPKDMEYREEYALEKRRKIALQARTLWMLTAGFATPLLTALTCNRIEKYIDKPLAAACLANAQREAVHLGMAADMKAASPLFDPQGARTLRTFQDYKGAADEAFFSRVANIFNTANFVENSKLTPQIPEFDERLKSDLKNLFFADMDDKDASQRLYDIIKSHFVKNEKEGTLEVPAFYAEKPGEKNVVQNFKVNKEKIEDAVRRVMLKVRKGEVEFSKEGIFEALNKEEGMYVFHEIEIPAMDMETALKRHFIGERCLDKMAMKIRKANPSLSKEQSFDEAWIKFRNKAKNKEEIEEIQKLFKDDKTLEKMKIRKKVFILPAALFDEKDKSIDKFIEDTGKKTIPSFLKKVGANYASARKMNAVLAAMDDVVKSMDNSFGSEYFSVVDSIFGVIKPSDDELRKLRANGDYASDFLQAKFQEIAQDKDKCSKLIQRISKSPVMNDKQRQKLVNKTVQKAIAKLDKISRGFSPEMTLFTELSSASTSSHKGFVGLVEKYVKEATNGIDATKDRVTLALELEMRAADGTLQQQWAEAQKTAPVKQSYETFLQDARRILYKSSMNDYSNTHYIAGNGQYYQKLHDVLFNKPMSENSTSIFESIKQGMTDSLNEMRMKMMAVSSNGVKAPSKGAHAAEYVNVRNGVDANIIKDGRLKGIYESALAQTDAVKYQMAGKPLKNLIYENASQKYNSKAWMKMFGPMALALIGVTLGAQLFIGRDKDKDLYMKKNTNMGAMNGNQ